MKITFKTFLLEGGAATAKFETSRANKRDIEKALKIVSDALDIGDLHDDLLGSTNLTLSGHKEDSGDIDIAIDSEEIPMKEAHRRMMALTNNMGTMNMGTKIGSYAVDVGSKKVQVDLMFVNSKSWAKFIYHSAQGDKSEYPGVVRNLLLQAVARNKHEPGKDFIIKKDNKLIARASRAIKLDVGLERLFKLAAKNKKGEYTDTMNKIQPANLAAAAKDISGKNIKFSHDPDIINDPDLVAQWLFGSEVTANDIMSAEQVIDQIKKLDNAQQIIDDAVASLKKNKQPIPSELTNEI